MSDAVDYEWAARRRKQEHRLVVCAYPSDVVQLATIRVVWDEVQDIFIMQWMRGFAYPPRVSSEHPIERETARAHWTHARSNGNQAIKEFP